MMSQFVLLSVLFKVYHKWLFLVSGRFFTVPKNTLKTNKIDLGYSVSTENNVSLLAGIKALIQILQTKGIFLNFMPLLQGLQNDIESFLKKSYDSGLGYFRQGGIVDLSGRYSWSTDETEFSVDCQSWTMTVLGPKKIDAWFGAGTAQRVWEKTKEIGGYHYTPFDKSVEGLGFSVNKVSQAFSGEWTLGAINMLRVLAAESGDNKFKVEADKLRQNVEFTLTDNFSINGKTTRAVKYVNKRYYIPFGWWANPLASIASTSWSVFLDSNFNPLYLGGTYTVYA